MVKCERESCEKRFRCPFGTGNWGLGMKAGTETLCAKDKEVGIDSEILNYL